MKYKKLKKIIKVHASLILAHLYCLFNWKWNVYHRLEDPNGDIVEGNFSMVGAGTESIDGSIEYHVYTYPEWLTDKPRCVFF